MKKAVWLSLGALVAISAVFAACGGDDDGGSNGGGDSTSNITVNKGAAVQAMVANLTGQSNVGGAEGATDDLALPAAADTDASNLGSDASRSSMGFGEQASGANPAQADGSGGGITVQGYGSATADADSAIIDFYFGGNYYGEVKPADPISDSDSGSGSAPDIAPSPGAVTPITEETLQPVIDALVNAGVSRDDIEFVDQGYYDPYYASANLRATVNDISTVDGAVSAATDAAAGLGDITLQSSNVMYTLQDCSALEQAALEAAVEDAADRGALLASALGVGLGSITAAADYSYYGNGGTSCGSSYPIPYYDVAATGSSSSQVQVFEQISITYAIN